MNVGGPSLHVGILTARLDPERFETLLVSGHEEGSEGNIFDTGRVPAGVTPLSIPELHRAISPLDDTTSLLKAIRIARSYRPDIVHTHLAKAGLVGRIAGVLSGARAIVHTYHGSVFRGYFGKRESALYLAIERALARITTRVIALSDLQRDELVNLGVAAPAKIVKIPLGLELERFIAVPPRSVARAALGVPGDAKCVALVARLVPIKDVGTFLRAIARLRGSVPTLQALVVGDGQERLSLEQLSAQLGLSGVCRFLGWRNDVEAVYAAADVVVLSSLNEGMPVSLIEAMASGAAVVAAAVGGVPDVVTAGTGILVNARDPDELGLAVGKLLVDDALRETLGGKARASVYPRFGAARLVTDIESLYQELLPSRLERAKV
jgi:glycosyltransferase involved in cell wall biosynthesis